VTTATVDVTGAGLPVIVEVSDAVPVSAGAAVVANVGVTVIVAAMVGDEVWLGWAKGAAAVEVTTTVVASIGAGVDALVNAVVGVTVSDTSVPSGVSGSTPS
jgi:hypothetical protein